MQRAEWTTEFYRDRRGHSPVEEFRTNIYRVVYFFYTGRRIVFLHGFQKKTERTPPGDLDIAKRRLDAFVAAQNAQRG